MNFNHIIISNGDGGNDNGFGKEMKKSIEKTFANLKKKIWKLDYRMHLKI
jgi:hypothetical protein